MVIIPEPIQFEWDEGNREKSFQKHGILPEEAEEVFLNIPMILLEDPKHSASETRNMALGKSDSRKLLSVVYTLRNSKIRIISSRPMSRKERALYEAKSV